MQEKGDVSLSTKFTNAKFEEISHFYTMHNKKACSDTTGIDTGYKKVLIYTNKNICSVIP